MARKRARKVTLNKIGDVRERRREEIIERAKNILRRWVVEETPTMDQVGDEIELHSIS